MFPEFQYWFSGAAIFLLLSFAITIIIGVIPMIDGKRRISTLVLLGVGLLVAVLGWWTAAKQEEKSVLDSGKLDAAQESLNVLRTQTADLIVKMNTGTVTGTPPEIALLAPDAPEWLKVAYKEIGQREIPGPQENPHIVEYFKTIGAKKDYRDDIDDWASAFVEWSLNQAGIHGPKSDEPFAWLEWGQDLQKPFLGCIVAIAASQASVPSRSTFGDRVGITRSSFRLASANSLRNSASVRMRPPLLASNMRMSNVVAGPGSPTGGMTISTTSTLPPDRT